MIIALECAYLSVCVRVRVDCVDDNSFEGGAEADQVWRWPLRAHTVHVVGLACCIAYLRMRAIRAEEKERNRTKKHSFSN